jgi:molybdopterin synthase catalytic subunit
MRWRYFLLSAVVDKMIVDGTIPVHKILADLDDPAAGAVVLFAGRVRDHNEEGSVHQIRYESYKEMAEDVMAVIEQEMRTKWKLSKIAMVHRIGTLNVGEASVVVAVSSEHRREAFDACKYGIDNIKNRVPIWKKEFMESGEAWVEGILPKGEV